MGKSRYSKTKAAGALCGMSWCGDYKFKAAGVTAAGQVQNRQMRRLSRKKG